MPPRLARGEFASGLRGLFAKQGKGPGSSHIVIAEIVIDHHSMPPPLAE
jgi:hypothetical protein